MLWLKDAPLPAVGDGFYDVSRSSACALVAVVMLRGWCARDRLGSDHLIRSGVEEGLVGCRSYSTSPVPAT